MNAEHVARWVQEMRTTTEGQVTGHLGEVDRDDNTVGYCCLGLGSTLVAGIEVVPALDPTGERGNRWITCNGADTLAPAEFLRWLGLATSDADDGDVFFDLPEDIKTQGDEDGFNGGLYLYEVIDSASTANDSGFTFAQIADLVDYFGIREAR